MSYAIFNRERHLRRLAIRRLRQEETWRWGGCHSDLYPRRESLRVDSPVFATREEALAWAKAHPEGDSYGYRAVYSSVAFSLKSLRCADEEVVSTRRPPGFYGVLYRRTGAAFREPTVTFETEDAERQTDHLVMKKRVQARDWLAVKPYRRRYHKQRRAAGKRAEHLALRGDLDGAECVDLHVGERGIMRDVT